MTRTHVVLGAASGMGAAVARLLAPRGRLLVADLHKEPLEALATDLDGDVEVHTCDITVPADVEALARAAGSVASLVVTAGLSPSMAGGRRIFDVNLIGAARVVEAFEPAVGPGSAAVLFASMAAHLLPSAPEVDAILDQPGAPTFFEELAALGFDPDQPGLAYALSKRGVVRLVEREAVRWGRRGARLLSLSPGIVDTPMGRIEAEHEPVMAGMVEASAVGRMARPDEVAAVAAFLVSDEASFLTGTDVLVDGGAVAASRP